MKFTLYDLGNRTKGEIVEVILSGNQANVQLLDSSNLSKYKNGKQYKYYGGLAKKSPVRITIPNSGHWYITVDLRGLSGTVNSSIKILPSPLPAIRDIPLSEIPSLVRRTDNDIVMEHDVFISHASEDKIDIASPLANALKKKNLKVWYDEFELKIGDSLRRNIDKGLANSKFGIVIISRNFINKGWTNYELDGLITKNISGEQILLPIWHDITKQEVISFSPSLADKVARNTATYTIEEIAQEIYEVITNP